jgi:uncharacterized membrane protein YeaQ/YmgE (transglycosylase-associated protein family)
MTHHTDTTGDLLSVMLGWVTAFFGQMALFGIDMLKAAILGGVGALAGLIVRHLWKKYFTK